MGKLQGHLRRQLPVSWRTLADDLPNYHGRRIYKEHPRVTVLLFIIGVVLMALAIAASIALHELGHLVPAKLFGVRVPQ